MNHCHIVEGNIKHTGNLESDYYRNLTGWGNPERMSFEELKAHSILPQEYQEVKPGEKQGPTIIEENRVLITAIPRTADDIKLDTYVPSISPRQCRLWLNAQVLPDTSTLLDAVEAAISTMSRAAQIEWEYGLEYKRDHTLVIQMATMLGKDENGLHQMFWEASQL